MSSFDTPPAERNRLFPALLFPVAIAALVALLMNGGPSQFSDGNWGEPLGRALGATILPLIVVKIWAASSKKHWSALRMIVTFTIIMLLLLGGLASSLSIGGHNALVYNIDVKGGEISERARLTVMSTVNCLLSILIDAVPEAAERAFQTLGTALETVE